VAFPVVGIGASAGGLEAFTQLFTALAADTGMAFVLVQHLDPTHESLLAEAIGRVTRMPVTEARPGMAVEPNQVFVMPPNAQMGLKAGLLALHPRNDQQGKPRLPVDAFFESMALDLGPLAIGVVLSGSASDGTEGLRAIRAADGLTLVQTPSSARFDGMPDSAVSADVADRVLGIPELAAELKRLGDLHKAAAAEAAPVDQPELMARLHARIQRVTGVNFAEHKQSTFGRRLARRMALRNTHGLEAYVRMLDAEPDEVRALCEDALIHVTSFFRDPSAFESLKTEALPVLLANKPPDAPIRVWVAGCATGEEVYSLAITILEATRDLQPFRTLQVFGSDVSERAVQKARLGTYSDVAMRDVSDERRRKFFRKVDGGYAIQKSVRDLCVFVRHDLARDPPFSRLDIISCRNVLIYFDTELQKRVIPTFHYALAQPGFLLLGHAESISGFGQFFTASNKADRLFARTSAPSVLRFAPRTEANANAPGPRMTREVPGQRAVDLDKHVDAVMLTRYAPPGVLVDQRMEVIQFRGETGPYLQPAPGQPQTNVLRMARGPVLAALRSTLGKAITDGTPVVSKPVDASRGGKPQMCTISVVPLSPTPNPTERLFLVTFEDVLRRAPNPVPLQGKTSVSVKRLQHELATLREYLQSVTLDHERADRDLAATNVELVSGNEELQSMNEELETAKEELQSTNEELSTVNDELQHRNHEVSLINSDLVNLIDTYDVPVLMLDMSRHVRRFTPKASAILGLQATDVGRPLDELRISALVPDLVRQVTEGIAANEMRESEVQDATGCWYRMRIRPYRTSDNRIDGVTISLVDIDSLKALVRAAQDARGEAERSNNAKDQFLANLSHELRTPLSAMSLHAQMLRRDPAPGVRLSGEAIERSGRLMALLIDDLLDVSRIVSGKLHLDMQPVDLAGLVRASVDALQHQVKRRSMEVVLDLEDGLGMAMGDPGRLQQVITNLLTNAIKFTPPEGRVTVSLAPANGWARVSVTDTGEGIPAAFLPHVFSRFSQAEATNTRRHGGLGLGLAIVRHLVEAHGGTVSAESAGLGQGSTFRVTLPLMATLWEDPETSEPAPAGTTPAAGDRRLELAAQALEGIRVLVLDDDHNIRDALETALQSLGAQVLTVGSCREADTLMDRFRPQVMVCDIAMPDEDGNAFMKRLRSRPAGAPGNVPALALTAFAADEDRARAMSAGYQMHLAKPVDLERLTMAMVDLVRQIQPDPAR
jgi:two-component system CheB/CheR fusion protein